MLDLTALEAEVTRNETVDGSAKLLIERLATELEAAKGDPVAIQLIVDRLRSHNDSLAAAVSANTPGAPPVEEPPADPEARRRQ